MVRITWGELQPSVRSSLQFIGPASNTISIDQPNDLSRIDGESERVEWESILPCAGGLVVAVGVVCV